MSDSLFRDAIRKWGWPAQLAQLQEECAELIAAVSHIRRRREGALQELIEELVDVHIMIRQIEEYLDENGKREEFARIWENKLDRLEERLKDE